MSLSNLFLNKYSYWILNQLFLWFQWQLQPSIFGQISYIPLMLCFRFHIFLYFMYVSTYITYYCCRWNWTKIWGYLIYYTKQFSSLFYICMLYITRRNLCQNFWNLLIWLYLKWFILIFNASRVFAVVNLCYLAFLLLYSYFIDKLAMNDFKPSWEVYVSLFSHFQVVSVIKLLLLLEARS